MFAIARLNTFDEQRLAAARADLAVFDRLHTRQPGYAGNVTIELGESRHMTINLWQSEEDAQAALQLLGPEVGRVLAPLMTAPSRLLGAGPADTDLAITQPRQRRKRG